MATIVIDLARLPARGQPPEWLMSYTVEAAWRPSRLGCPAVPVGSGAIVAVFSGGSDPVSVAIGRSGDPPLAFTLGPGERREVGVRAGERIEILPANLVRLDVPRRSLTAPSTGQRCRGPDRRRFPLP